MDLGIVDRVAAVAASSRGLGLAVARALAREGARVALCSRDRERVEAAAREVGEEARAAGFGGERALPVVANLSTATGVTEFLERAARALGPVEILVVNNGGPPPGRASEIEEEQWARGIEQTFLSSVRLARGVLDGMRERGWGRIVFITSVSVKQPIDNLAISTALRSGVVGYAKSLADEVAAAGVTVNTVAPGFTDTERLAELFAARAEREGSTVEAVRAAIASQVPAGRTGRPAELADAVAFLASERASYITGTVLSVDGGQARSLT